MRTGEINEAIKALCLVLLCIGLALMSGCTRDNVRPDLPQAAAVTPQVVIVERKVFVAIPAHLTRTLPVAEGAINQCFDVAARRRAAQATLNAQLVEIAAIEGTEVSP